MKIQMLSRNPSDYRRETTDDIFKFPRSFNTTEHPFSTEREYVRAANAAKMERMFAKPYIGCCEGGTDSVSVMSLNPETLGLAIFGTHDGKIQYWNVAQQKKLFEKTIASHVIRGLCFNKQYVYSCSLASQHGQLHQWSMSGDLSTSWSEPVSSATLRDPPYCMDHHPRDNLLCIGGTESAMLYCTDRWDEPSRTWEWGREIVHAAKFNPIEFNMLAVLARNNTVQLIDIRLDQPIRKMKMHGGLNTLSWNPLEAFSLTCASDDHNLYTFDVRKFTLPRRVHKGHTNAVLDVDYAPTGQEFASASTDGTVRLWRAESSASRDVYHARRMKQVLNVRVTLDSKFLLTNSSDMNVRVWKMAASEKLGPLRHREKTSLAEAEALRQKYAHHPEIRRILKHRHLPKPVHVATREHRIMDAKQRRKERNVRGHAPPGTHPFEKEREKHTAAVDE